MNFEYAMMHWSRLSDGFLGGFTPANNDPIATRVAECEHVLAQQNVDPETVQAAELIKDNLGKL